MTSEQQDASDAAVDNTINHPAAAAASNQTERQQISPNQNATTNETTPLHHNTNNNTNNPSTNDPISPSSQPNQLHDDLNENDETSSSRHQQEESNTNNSETPKLSGSSSSSHGQHQPQTHRYIYTPAHHLIRVHPLDSPPLDLPLPPNSVLYQQQQQQQAYHDDAMMMRSSTDDLNAVFAKKGPQWPDMKKEVVLVREMRQYDSIANSTPLQASDSAAEESPLHPDDSISSSDINKQHSQNPSSTSTPSTFPRHQWKEKLFSQHSWVKEVHDRVHPFHRTLEFLRTYELSAKKSLKERLEVNREEPIAQIVMQHLLFEGLKETKEALCEDLGIEYRNIDAEGGSLLYELVKEAVKKSEQLTNLIMDDLPEQRHVDASTIEQQLHDMGFEEDSQLLDSTEPENWSLWDEITELNVCFDERFVNSDMIGLDRGISSIHKELQRRHIQYASLNVLIIRLTSVTKNEFCRLERTWQGKMKSHEEIMKQVHKLFPQDTGSYDGSPFVAATPHEHSFVDIFLMTFPSFCTQMVFLNKMMDRFHVPKSRSEYEIQLIEKTIFRVLNSYVTRYSTSLTTEFIEGLMSFLREKEALGYFEASQLMKNLERSLSSWERENAANSGHPNKPYPKPLYPHNLLRHNFQWHHVNPQELARQLTLIDFDYFRKIESVEFMNLAWSKPRLKHRAPNLLRMIDRFNRLSRWVASVIIRPKQLSERRRVYSLILSIMDHLLQIGNFSSLMAFLGALSNTSVKRLRRTCSNHQTSLVNKLAHIRSVMSSQSNHIVYRNMMRSRREESLPTIPFLGFGQTTLTMAEEGNTEDTVPNPHLGTHGSSRRLHKTLINWEKKALIHSIIEGMLYFQEKPFHYCPIHQIQIELTRLREEVSSEKELHEMSLEHGNEADDKHFEK